MTKIAYLTGATGGLGRNILIKLISDGWHVTCLHRQSSNFKSINYPNTTHKIVDFNYPPSIYYSLAHKDINAFFHCSGNMSTWKKEQGLQWDANVNNTRNIINTCKSFNVEKFIFTSTAATCDRGNIYEIPYQYIRTKAIAEDIVEKSGLNYIIMKPCVLLGKYDRNYIKLFDLVNKSKFKIIFPGSIEFCHIEDVAQAHVRAYYDGKIGEKYILGGRYHTWLELFQWIYSLLKEPYPVKPSSIRYLKFVARLSQLKGFLTRSSPLLTTELVDLLTCGKKLRDFEVKKAEKDLGYHCRSLETMVKDMFDYWIQTRLTEGNSHEKMV